MAEKIIKIKLVKSSSGHKPNQKATLKALGLTKLQQVVEKPANDAVLGMIKTVEHLVVVEE
jgi:large subunit ribosomal protein L30